ncbi:MAG: helix-turn-helix domain-containing protein [Pyrinomonadaceae bacterium]
MSDEIKLISVAEAAKILGVTRARVNQFITDKRLPAQRIGRSFAIREEDLQLIQNRRTGRPPKVKGGK